MSEPYAEYWVLIEDCPAGLTPDGSSPDGPAYESYSVQWSLSGGTVTAVDLGWFEDEAA